MIKRQKITRLIAQQVNDNVKLISCLGRISRDIYYFIDSNNKDNCFFNVGAMGTTLPLALGLAIAMRDKEIYSIEGDGSILMNLGGLVTYKRYNPGNLTLFIIDNKQYETTGGQPSQPENFNMAKVCMAIGLKTVIVNRIKSLEMIFKESGKMNIPYDIIVLKGLADKVSQRITEKPFKIKERFVKKLTV